jgi:transcriptional regulator with XRE-family HTH domain
MEAAGIGVAELAAAAGLDTKLVTAIVTGNFTPSPVHRQRLAAAIGVAVEDISWGHAVPVQHLRGNGPQAGRPT